MIEEWRDVPGYDGLYRISIDTKEGECYSISRGKCLSNKPNKREGRIVWSLHRDGVLMSQQAARWIAITFPELVQNEYFEGAHIDHIDTDRLNNHPSNLRWVTPKENSNNPVTLKHQSKAHKGQHPTEDARKKMSETRKRKQFNRQDQSKWVIKLSLDNEILHFYQSTHQAERETGIDHSHITKCCKGLQKSAGGYIWKYAS